ncbi:hypothetical protein IKI_02903 [Bacillus toyonensis]|uniref:RloB family protein n=1 Tax=Bacillus toyonensis TaxID=155322 RepID=UPI00032D7593|nr:RloB family protein [Bacillus toyonensis]EOP40058.1 hypothetical protein IKI_02903 [Bacillus toyonensis]
MGLPTRGRKGKQVKKTIYIFCEGKETEVHYLNAIKQQLKAATVKVNIKGVGQSSQNLLDYAIACTKGAKDVENIWIVFDKDDLTPNEISSTVARAKRSGIEVAFTNCSFEVWLLLHFECIDSSTNCDRRIVYRKLQRYLNIKKYEDHKSDVILLSDVAGNYRKAIINNKKLLQSNTNLLTSPYSNVVNLIESFA